MFVSIIGGTMPHRRNYASQVKFAQQKQRAALIVRAAFFFSPHGSAWRHAEFVKSFSAICTISDTPGANSSIASTKATTTAIL
jgi:hypothetical protein